MSKNQKHKHYKVFLIKCYKHTIYSLQWFSNTFCFASVFWFAGNFLFKEKADVVSMWKKKERKKCNVKSQCCILRTWFSSLPHVAIWGRFWEPHLKNHFCGFLCFRNKSQCLTVNLDDYLPYCHFFFLAKTTSIGGWAKCLQSG